MIVGMDFGTTNSGMAVHDEERLRLLPLDPANMNPAVARTALYITNDHDITTGRAAIDHYFDHNVGRPVKLKKVWVGEVEVYGADMFYVTDVFAWVDILSPGRLFLSIKSGLSDADYQGTMIGRFYYSLENLIAAYLASLKYRAERILDREISSVVLGRPVHFSEDPAVDNLAEARLLEAAYTAGYDNVYLQYEPIAAAYYYASTIDRPQNALVFDFGGGTLDITIMRLNPEGAHRVLSTGGIPVAGDVFDRKLVRAKLPKHFGEGTKYRSTGRWLPMPEWIFDMFSNWQTIIELQTPSNRKLLNEIAQTAEARAKIEGLISLVANNYGLQMFDTVEAAKRQLSEMMGTVIRLNGPGFRVTEPLNRNEFEQLIFSETKRIGSHIDETVQLAGLTADQIDAVIRTGGSSEIPVFKYLLMSRFGAEKVHKSSTFSSVASGLGIIAHGISAGDIQAERKQSRIGSFDLKSDPGSDVASINIDLLKLRIASSEGDGDQIGKEQILSLVILGTDGHISVSPWSLGRSNGEERQLKATLAARIEESGVKRAMVIEENQALLLATSRYRFLVTSPKRLAELYSIGMDIREYYSLKEQTVSAIYPWSLIRGCPKLVVVTSEGFVRDYALSKMVDVIEGPTGLKFDQPLLGSPSAVLGSSGSDYLICLSESGRASRIKTGQIQRQGQKALKLKNGDQVACVLLVEEDDELILATSSGFGRRLPARWIPQSGEGKNVGRSVLSRPNLRDAAAVHRGKSISTITSGGLLSLDPMSVPLGTEGSTRSRKLLKLPPNQEILGFVSDFQSTS